MSQEVLVWKRLERAALAAWPAADVAELDGWRLRAMQGITRRANSAWAGESRGKLSLEEKLSRVRAFYVERGLATCFYVCPVSEPSGLDAELERRGFRKEGGVSVQTASPEQVLSRARGQAPCEVEEEASARYLELSVYQGRYASVPDVYLGLLRRLAGRAWFARLDEPTSLDAALARAASTALAVPDGPDLGLFSMTTRADMRRRGYGEALLRGIASRAAARGLKTIYLQVDLENAAALQLYAQCGFVERYQYHYRLRDELDTLNPRSNH